MFASVAVAALLAAAQAAPEAAAAPADKPAAEAQAQAKPKTRRVCYADKNISTRVKKKTCVTEVVDEKEDAAKGDKPGA